ncbi:MAG: YciI family protein [Gemmatimonadaceae bacterium]
MYAIAMIRYRRAFDQIEPHVDEHRAYLRALKADGTLLASGPVDPRSGGILLLRVPDGGDVIAALDKIRDNDPFTHRALAQYELIPWNVVIGKEDLDKLGVA